MRRSTARNSRRTVRRKGTTTRGGRPLGPTNGDADLEPLTREQLREIERRLRDLDDPTRYFLVSDFGAGFKLYYEISDGVYVMNELSKATLFKTREAALAVKATLGPGIKLVRCTTTIKGGKRMPIVTPSNDVQRERGESRSRRTRG